MGSRRGPTRGASRRWAWLGGLGLVVVAGLAVALAQPEVRPLQLPSPAIWLTPFDGGAAALLENGRVVHVVDGVVTELGRGFQGDTLLACGGDLYGVDRVGRLIALRSGVVGPRVSLHGTPGCLPEGRVVALADDGGSLLLLAPDLDATLAPVRRAAVNALPDTEIVIFSADGVSRLALLTGPTLRYRHGVLGDEVEAAGVALFDADLNPLADYTLPAPYVLEQRRVIPADDGADGLFLTRSSERGGAGVLYLAPAGEGLDALALGGEIGLSNRWLNLFAARDGRGYAVVTPHIGGPFVRYQRDGDNLVVEAFDLGVTNHQIGSRNLDLGLLLPRTPDDAGADRLVLPRRDLRALIWIRCDDDGCRAEGETPLGARLSSNLALLTFGEGRFVLAGDERGGFYRIPPPSDN